MKHLTLTIGALCLAAVASGQRLEKVHSFEQHSVTKASTAELVASRQSGMQLMENFQRGGGTIIFQEDFSNGFAGSNGNGAWTTTDNAGDSLWVHVAGGGTTGFYSDGSPTGVDHPGGEYSTNIGVLESTTADNGWMIFDCDYYNTPISEGYQNTDGSLISPIMDFSNEGSVILSWEQYFRYCCYPYAPIYVEVSNDAGATWTVFDGHGSFIESANTASANPLPTTLDISCVAAYSAEVQIKFTYMQAPEVGDGYSHYYWGIDDVTITANPNENDLEITQLTNGDIWNVWEYRVTPFEQRISAADGGLIAGVLYRNNGTADQTNVDLIVEVLDEDGNVLSTTMESVETIFSMANAPTCPAPSQDTLYVQTGWEPEAVGNYILRATLDSGIEDTTPLDNTTEKVITYSDDEYAHHVEADLNNEAVPRESDIAGLYDPAGFGAFYHMVNGGSTAWGITVKFGASAGQNLDGDQADLEFETRLYYYDPEVGITDSDFESAYWTFDPNWAGTTQYFSFDDPVDMAAGDVYFVGILAEYESEGGLSVQIQTDSDTDNSTGEYAQTGAGDFVWFTSQTYHPAVSLILSERISVDEIAAANGVTLNQNIPNPATNETTFKFEINQSRDISLEIRDLSGRVVASINEGTLGAGVHTVNYDVSALSAGLYTYTLIADDVSLTKKMTVK